MAWDILVIEDDESIRRLFLEFLNCKGANAGGLPGANSILRSLNAVRVDLVITDIGLKEEGNMAGIEVIRGFSARGIPTIGMTGRGGDEGDEVKIASFEAGASDFIFKPCKLEKIWTTIEEVMEKSACPGKY